MDAIDVSGFGLVRLRAGNVYVTPNSFYAPDGTTAPSIQRGVDAASAGDTVNVEAGTYAENVVVGKSVTLKGANVGVNPITGTRGAETIVEPGLNSSYDTDSIFVVEANNVAIDGFTIQGSIASPPHGQSAGFTLTSGVTVYAAAGVSNSANINTGGSSPSTFDIFGLTVQNNIVQDFTQVGVDGDTSDGTPSTGNTIADNLINDIPNNGQGGYYGEGVIIYDNFYADVTDNKLTKVRTGIQTGNNYLSAGAYAPSISDNTVSAYVKGVYYNLQYESASTFTVSDNTITQADATVSPAYNVGLLIQSIQSSVQASIQGNNVSGFLYGVEFAGNNTTNTVTVQGGTLNDNTYGVWDTNNDYFYPANYNTTAALDGVAITNSTTAGVWVDSTSPNSSGQYDTTDATTLSILDGTSITGNPVGLLVDGAHSLASLQQSTLSGNATGVSVEAGGALTSATQNFIHNNTGAGVSVAATAGAIGPVTDNDLSGNGGPGIDNLTSTVIDGSLNWWGDASGPTAASNPGGTGVGVSTVVDYSPWLTTGTDASLVTPGFQGDFSQLTVNPGSPRNPAQVTAGTANLQEGVDDVLAGGTVTARQGTYAENVTISKNLTLAGVPGSPPTAIVHPSSGDGITISSPATNVTIENLLVTGAANGVTATGSGTIGGGAVTLQNLVLNGNATGFSASNLTTLNLDNVPLMSNSTQGGSISNVGTVNDTPSTGSSGVTVTITGATLLSGGNQSIAYTGVAFLNVTGSGGADTFNVTPAASTTITVHGGLPTPPASPGDALNVGLSGASNPVLNDTYSSSSGYSGSWTFGNRAAVNFDGIETLSPSGPEVAVLKTSGELDLLTPGTNATVEISPAGSIRAVVATMDASFNNDIFAISELPGYAGTLWEYSDASGWKEISSGSFAQISATTNASGQAVVFGVLADGSLWEQNPAGAALNAAWTQLSPAGTIQSVSAVTDSTGAVVAVAISNLPGYAGTVWEHTDASGWQYESSGSFTQVSADLNASGQAIIFGMLSDGSLWEQDPAGAGLNVDWTGAVGREQRAERDGRRRRRRGVRDRNEPQCLPTNSVGSDAAVVHRDGRVGQRHGNAGTGRGVRRHDGRIAVGVFAGLPGQSLRGDPVGRRGVHRGGAAHPVVGAGRPARSASKGALACAAG